MRERRMRNARRERRIGKAQCGERWCGDSFNHNVSADESFPEFDEAGLKIKAEGMNFWMDPEQKTSLRVLDYHSETVESQKKNPTVGTPKVMIWVWEIQQYERKN